MSDEQREQAIQQWIDEYGVSRQTAEWYVDTYGDEEAAF